jgi:peptidyl-prolyl cis-trans isomerase A (cyclophilin A)
MRLGPGSIACLLALAAAGAVPAAEEPPDREPAAPAAPGAPGGITVSLELAQQFYYEGDPLSVRISVRNASPAGVPNPVRSPLFAGFRVRRAEGEFIRPQGPPRAEEPARPDTLTPEAFYGGVVNLVESHPQLAGRGKYEIHWSADGLISNMLLVTVIPRYDPALAYAAQIVTDLGTIEIDLLPAGAPIALKAFVDMAQAGLYDGLTIHEVQADAFISGGDPRFVDPPRRAISFPAESSSLPLLSGTVVLRPVRAAPPANGPGFMILLRPQPTWTGQVTAIGQVVRGLDIVQRISRVPASPRNAQPPGKPLKDVAIRTVVIRGKPAAVVDPR